MERLELAQLFAVTQPLEVELGCGDASFIAEYAQRNPGVNLIGVERLLGRIQKLHRKGSRLGLTNLRGVADRIGLFSEMAAAAGERVGLAHLFS